MKVHVCVDYNIISKFILLYRNYIHHYIISIQKYYYITIIWTVVLLYRIYIMIFQCIPSTY